MTTAVNVRRIGRPRRLAVDVVSALNLVGSLAKYMSLACLLPIGVALGYSDRKSVV